MSSTSKERDVLRLAIVALAVVVLLPFVMMIVAAPMMGMGMMGGWGGGMMGHWGGTGGYSPLWGLGTMLIWLLVLAGIVYVVYRGFGTPMVSGATTEPALEELRLAYARGDLSDEEFERRRETLERED